MDFMRGAVRAVKNKKLGFLKDLTVRVLHSISSRIRIMTLNYFLCIRT
jgi:hypothetical protein